MEYDTVLDPADPITASAQLLFKVITSFVTGLVDVPREMARDLVSASRAIRQPHEHFDSRAACQAVMSSPDHLVPEDRVESEETQIQTEGGQLPIENGEQRDADIREEDEAQEAGSDEENESRANELARVRSAERKRNLQHGTAKPMSNSMTPSKPPKFTLLREAALHGSQMSKKILRVIIWVPTDLSLGMTRGFHNAPKLYHDRTVKDVPKVASLRSGIRAAGKVVTAILYPVRSQTF